jgi:hypothetical protein
MDIQKRELWDRLENESERAYRAFECFLSLPSGERTLLGAYRQHVGNPDAVKPSDTWSGWSSSFAWKQRARSYDAHIDRIRRKAMEKAIEEQTRQAERTRNNLNELMAVGHLKVMEFLDELDPSSMRFSDVAQVIRLHMEAVEKLGSPEEVRPEDDWTEEDDEFIEKIAKEIKAKRDSEECAQGPEEQDSESYDSDEEHSEQSEGEEP